MPSNRKKNKIKAKELLEAFSVDAIIEHITDINSRITTLINCSSEDFLNLHSKFIKTHENIKQVVIDASEILNAFGEESNIGFINDCTEAINILRGGIKNLITNIQDSQYCQTEISRTLDYLYIPINNYNQNLKTYKLLSANLKLDYNTIKYSNELNSIIEDIIEKYPDLVMNFKSLRALLVDSGKMFDTFNTNYFNSIYDSLEFIIGFGQFLLHKHHQSKKLKQKLREKTDKSNESASKIITHLQYQDIVRQKIEHIQQTHLDILDKLTGLMKNEDHPDFILSKAKLLIQIRDIAGLQAAQLIHANSEYQNAIDVITSRFIGLGEVLYDIIQICKQFSSLEMSQIEQANYEPGKVVAQASFLVKNLEAFRNTLNQKPESVNSKIHAFSEKYINLKNTGIHFNRLVNSIMQDASFANSDIINQMNEVSAEFLKTLDQIELFISKTTENSDKLDAIIHHHFSDEVLNHAVLQPGQHLLSVTKAYNKEKSAIFHKFLTNFDNCAVSDNIKESIESIRYYELFEKEIETIILNLDNISKKLHIEDELMHDETKETLESLKKRYTVKSEFLVHEHISYEAQKGKTELFVKNIKIIPQKIDEDDENLELF